MAKISKPEYEEKVKKLSEEETERLLSRMSGKLPRRLQKEKLTLENALAIQMELEDEQLQQWRKAMAELNEKLCKKAGAKVKSKPPKKVAASPKAKPANTKAAPKPATEAKAKSGSRAATKSGARATAKAKTPTAGKIAGK